MARAIERATVAVYGRRRRPNGATTATEPITASRLDHHCLRGVATMVRWGGTMVVWSDKLRKG